jgi:acyl-CoA thioesterase-1
MAAVLLATCGEGRLGGSAARAPAAEAPSPPTPAIPNPPADAPSIVFLGTSLTAGLGLDPDSAFPALLQRKLDSAGLRYSVVNAGESGESSAGAVRRIDWILRQPPAMLVIETGANDGLRGQDPDSIRGNIQAMIERIRARAPETRIVLVGMEALPNLGQDYVRRFRAIYPAVARANAVPLIPFLLAGVAGVDSLNQQDGIHPNAKGERIVAENVWKVLRPMLR